ncbi:MAG: ABC transporter ATP-binding protein [Alphaproteobacteria bacterium]|jgi:branched-chain amino acid transport system ATP-binding protein|nr:ABC transporter ATP-binding protein [Alphaproteobacteria bacterium]
MTECMLKLENVVAGYGYGPDIIKNINLELNKGDIKCIIGPNGAGKSTVLKAIAGIIKPRNGTVVFNSDNGEINLSGMETYKIMKTGLCFIPQDRSLFSTLTVSENLAMAGYTLNDKQEVKNRTEEVLETFPRLKERLSQYAGTMSGGEQQQLIFARAIILKPRVILIDEPSLGLAPAIVEQAFQHIENIAKTGVSILLVEQNARRGLSSSNYGTVMDLGEIVFEKEANEVLNDDRIQELYLGKRKK